ncbi:hypothetical protein [Deinococcus budaensis]|uniref:Uncharacterized protein n=1 Tax=Deinococcus budaensis TaxID=1665626 RepID=A0A7W8GI18_9DEIO|nr:hypothetical protein [Deinococcus budaensis]MBB5235546.1 hypothetical protein [Deinococcus budaensis]
MTTTTAAEAERAGVRAAPGRPRCAFSMFLELMAYRLDLAFRAEGLTR